MNEAQNLMAGIGAKSIDQKRMEMAGAMTRMIYNEVVAEAKKRAAIRDATVTPQIVTGETPSQNG
jgi:CheY-specific phosphatase CheX